MAKEKCWYYVSGSSSNGPYTIQEIAQFYHAQTINQATLVWCPQMSEWKPLNSVSNFSSLFSHNAPPPQPVATAQPTSKANVLDFSNSGNSSPGNTSANTSDTQSSLNFSQNSALDFSSAGKPSTHSGRKNTASVRTSRTRSHSKHKTDYDKLYSLFCWGWILAIPTCGIAFSVASIAMLIFTYKLWDMTYPKYTKTSALMNLVFSLIPIFQLVWFFISMSTLAKNLNIIVANKTGNRKSVVDENKVWTMLICMLIPIVNIYAIILSFSVFSQFRDAANIIHNS